jgi:hypothetical protein
VDDLRKYDVILSEVDADGGNESKNLLFAPKNMRICLDCCAALA